MSTAENPHAGQGMVVLDIGDDIGALVVAAPASMAGLEVEICPSDARDGVADEGAGWWQGDWRSHSHTSHGAVESHEHTHQPAWPHVAVIGRPVASGTEYSAVYPGLREGRYDLWLRPNEPTALTVTVKGGQVTTVAWPDAHHDTDG
ncbi:MAG: hypothetical protein ABJB98_04225 [Actinomycetota bacterium]